MDTELRRFEHEVLRATGQRVVAVPVQDAADLAWTAASCILSAYERAWERAWLGEPPIPMRLDRRVRAMRAAWPRGWDQQLDEQCEVAERCAEAVAAGTVHLDLDGGTTVPIGWTFDRPGRWTYKSPWKIGAAWAGWKVAFHPGTRFVRES